MTVLCVPVATEVTVLFLKEFWLCECVCVCVFLGVVVCRCSRRPNTGSLWGGRWSEMPMWESTIKHGSTARAVCTLNRWVMALATIKVTSMLCNQHFKGKKWVLGDLNHLSRWRIMERPKQKTPIRCLNGPSPQSYFCSYPKMNFTHTKKLLHLLW